MRVIKLIAFWLFTTLSINHANSQSYSSLFDSLYQQNDENLALQLDSLISSQKSQYGEEEAAKMAHVFSIGYYNRRNFSESNLSLSLKYGLKEVTLYDKAGLKNKAFSKALYQVGFLYEEIDDYKSAISYHERVINFNIDPEYVARSYCKIGSCHDGLGDLYKALDYYNEGIFRLEELGNYRSLARNYINLAVVHSRIGTEKSLDLQLDILKKTEALQQYFPFSAGRFSRLQNMLADYYNTTSRFDFNSALHHYNLILERSRETKDSININAAFVNLGILYSRQDLDSAEWFLKESLLYPASRLDRAKSYRALSDFYLEKKALDLALKNIETGININLWGSKNFVDKVITEATLQNAVDHDEALSAITSKAKVLIQQYQESKNLQLISEALSSLQSADTLVNIIQNESSEELSKLLWRRRASEVYSKAILCAEVLNKKEFTFYFSEKIKALLLTENIINKARNETLPENIRDNEKVIKGEILSRQNQLKTIKSTSKIKKIKKELISSKLQYQQFIDSLRYIYPGFYSQKSIINLFSLGQIQQQLKKNTVVVSFVWDTDEVAFDNIYGILVTKEASEVFLIHELDTLRETITEFRQMLSKPFETQTDQDSYHKISFQLFKTLFPTEEIRGQVKNKQLLILPDNQLHNIPFEALVTDQHTGEYLIQKSEISYGYSMSFLLHNKSVVRKAPNDFIGFSPEQFGYDNLKELSWSGYEVDNIQNILNGKVLKKNNASKKAFLQQSGNYEIVHLATHSNAGQDPWIAYGDSKMDLSELYNLKSNADLIFLSSCNTTLGNIAEGEGVLNLARGFFYAGANSVVSTLWNINDKSASIITKEFYQNIKNGATKSKALHEAKLQYLKTHSLSDSSPYYWASFILIGDYEAVPAFSKNRLWPIYTVLILLILILMGGVLYSIRKKRKFLR